jgi:ankyrin repeat protein
MEHNEILDCIGGGRVAELQRFIDAGYPIDMKDATIVQAVFKALSAGHADMVAFALAHGCNANSLIYPGSTLLSVAVCIKSIGIVTTLIKNGADVDRVSKMASQESILAVTPLQLAVQTGDASVINALLDAGADINKIAKGEDGYGLGPIHHAVGRGARSEGLLILLRRGADVELRASKNHLTPLHGAAINGNLEACKTLVEHGANIHATTRRGATARDLAVDSNHQVVGDYFKSLGVKRSWLY